ncbi:hypothetical protein Ddye_013546 [Dipteronia dyeriana]|uniref:SWIM-type domain-containing protein n=1 Tax=Dipteronia dyeriana TaxID=168575 RepID=A0AAD9X6H5_9ROSI|nr:hypothetical protein Ddye_013546 [Dipteronia dyeriana]
MVTCLLSGTKICDVDIKHRRMLKLMSTTCMSDACVCFDRVHSGYDAKMVPRSSESYRHFAHTIDNMGKNFVNECNEESTMFTARSINVDEFLVKDGDKDGLVNLIERTCTCREFQIDILPCKHVLAASRACKKIFIDFCSDHYKKSSLVEAYSGVIRPVRHKSVWRVPQDISSIVVNAPPWLS